MNPYLDDGDVRLTIREHAEAILDDGAECSGMKRSKQHAQAIIDALDAANHYYQALPDRVRLIPDPRKGVS